MNRLPLILALFVATGCASAPKAPDELIVGTWECVLSHMPPGSRAEYVATFRRAGSMRISFAGQFDVEGIDVDVDMSANGYYTLGNMRMDGRFEEVTIRKLLIEGEPADEDMMSMFETMFLEMMAEATDSPVHVLDEKKLILGSGEHSATLSCSRRAA
ncbi:MAG: hypothetical protein R3C46_03885 [Hyphomonadaceae bacterium]